MVLAHVASLIMRCYMILQLKHVYLFSLYSRLNKFLLLRGVVGDMSDEVNSLLYTSYTSIKYFKAYPN